MKSNHSNIRPSSRISDLPELTQPPPGALRRSRQWLIRKLDQKTRLPSNKRIRALLTQPVTTDGQPIPVNRTLCKTHQRLNRTRITITCNAIKTKVQNRESRRTIRVLVKELDRLMKRTDKLNDCLSQEDDDEELIRQFERHLDYVTTAAAKTELADQYLLTHADDATSVSSSASAPRQPPAPLQHNPVVQNHDRVLE